MQHDLDQSRFTAALFEADDVGAIIRCHYEAERALDFLLDKLTDGRSNRKAKGWAFAVKLEICRLLGVQDVWTVPLKVLNDHRNDFAHKGTHRLSDQQVLDLYHEVRRLSPTFSEDFRLTFTGKVSFDKAYKECSNKEKYVMMILFATAMFSSLPQITGSQSPSSS